MATTGFLGVAASRGDPMSQMDAEDLIEFLLKSNQEMVAAAREWEDSAAQERQKLEVEIAGLRGRCAEYETIIEENERGLRQQLAKSSRNVQDLTEALREEASIGCEENEQLRVETEQLRVEIVQLQRERDAALLRAKKAEKASKTKAKEATDLRKELLTAREAKGVSLQDAQEMQDELETARNERTAMEKELGTMRKHHEHTAEYKRQTMVYLKRYEKQIAELEREQKELVRENAELRREAHDTEAHRLAMDAASARFEGGADIGQRHRDPAAAAAAAASARSKSLSAKFTPPSTPTDSTVVTLADLTSHRQASAPGSVPATADAHGGASSSVSQPAGPQPAAAETFSTPSRGPEDSSESSGSSAREQDDSPPTAMATLMEAGAHTNASASASAMGDHYDHQDRDGVATAGSAQGGGGGGGGANAIHVDDGPIDRVGPPPGYASSNMSMMSTSDASADGSNW
jgi:hypothetical protein